MKKLLAVYCLLTGSMAFSQTNSIKLETVIERVTVFTNKAQVTRRGNMAVPAGRSQFVIAGLSPFIDFSTVKIEAGEGVGIVAISPQTNMLKQVTPRKEVVELNVAIKNLQKQLAREDALNEALSEQAKILASNYQVNGQNVNLQVENLKAVTDLLNQRIKENKLQTLDNLDRQEILEDSIKKLSEQLKVQNASNNISTTEILVDIESDKAVTATFFISYIVDHAGWEPCYDIHVQDLTHPLLLSYKAKVFQNTGEVWKNVKFAFTNSDPNLRNVPMVLQPLFLREPVVEMYKVPLQKADAVSQSAGVYQQDKNKGIYVRGARSMEDGYYVDGTRVSYWQQNPITTTVNFELNSLFSLPSDGKPQSIEMKAEEIPASFQYQCVPKLESKAYLIADVANWNDYNLLNAEANLYYENTFTGKTFLSTDDAQDTLHLSLGVDKAIVVSRKRVKDYSKKQVLGENKTMEANFELAIRNNKKFPAKITVLDQIPVSTSKEILVEQTETGGGLVDPETGIITWKIELGPAKESKLKFGYTVKAPRSYYLPID